MLLGSTAYLQCLHQRALCLYTTASFQISTTHIQQHISTQRKGCLWHLLQCLFRKKDEILFMATKGGDTSTHGVNLTLRMCRMMQIAFCLIQFTCMHQGPRVDY